MHILLFAPAFYDYHHHIVHELESQGHSVRFIAERPSRWIYSPAKRLPLCLRQPIFNRYLKNVLQTIKGEKFDRVLLIRGEIVKPWFVKALRLLQPQARFIMYQWDSYRVTDFRPLVPLFDKVSTFDPVDAKELDLHYLPLFYVPQYVFNDEKSNATHDLAFVGSYHAARYKTLLRIRAACESAGIRWHHHLYISPIDYYKLKLLQEDPPARDDITFKKLDTAAILAIYRDTTSILDIENAKQTGLTMRTFEALATGRNLVTTNALASKLLPELNDQIIVIDREHITLSRTRLRATTSYSDKIANYSLHHWTNVLLGI